MLVLKRNVGESILIGDGIELTVLECSNGIVKLGIEAPKEVKIVRKELIAEVKKENQESVTNIDKLLDKIK